MILFQEFENTFFAVIRPKSLIKRARRFFAKNLNRLVALIAIVLTLLLFSSKFVTSILAEKPYIIFSQASGFYADPITLTLATSKSGAEIRYTVDGAIPTEESLPYTSPIFLTKPTVIRAQVYKNDSSGKTPIGKVFSNTFIIGRDFDLPVISIITEPDNLWSKKTGIYVGGENKNFFQRGRDWERPVFVQYFEPDGKLGFAMDLGLRIHGGATRSNSQKGLRLIARREYGQNLIIHRIFPGVDYHRFRRLLLRASGNDWWSTMMRDALMQSLVKDLSIDTQNYRPSVVYLNGEYWGIHNIREYFDERYFKNHYGVKDDTVVVLHPDRYNNGYPEIIEGDIGDEQHYLEMFEFIKTQDMSLPQNYAYIQTQMDVENFIDYFNSQLYFCNDDWNHHNLRVWRFKTQEYDPQARYGLDGRWRWLMYDTDTGFDKVGSNLLEFVTAPNIKGHEFATVIIRGLLNNPDFKQDFINRHADLLNSVFLPQVVIGTIDSIQAGIANEIPFHIQKWGGRVDKGNKPAFNSVEKWEENVDHLREFARLRPDISRQHFVEKFGLSGVTSVEVNATGNGTVYVNKLEVTSFPSSVIYFRDVSVPLLAKPALGYKFVGWESDTNLDKPLESKENSVVFSTEKATITAKFEPIVPFLIKN